MHCQLTVVSLATIVPWADLLSCVLCPRVGRMVSCGEGGVGSDGHPPICNSATAAIFISALCARVEKFANICNSNLF